MKRRFFKQMVSNVLIIAVLLMGMTFGAVSVNADEAIAADGEYYTIFYEDFEGDTLETLKSGRWIFEQADTNYEIESTEENGSSFLVKRAVYKELGDIPGERTTGKFRFTYDLKTKSTSTSNMMTQLYSDESGLMSLSQNWYGGIVWEIYKDASTTDKPLTVSFTEEEKDDWIRIENIVDFGKNQHTMTIMDYEGSIIATHTENNLDLRYGAGSLVGLNKLRFNAWEGSAQLIDNVRMEMWIDSEDDLVLYDEDFSQYKESSDVASDMTAAGWTIPDGAELSVISDGTRGDVLDISQTTAKANYGTYRTGNIKLSYDLKTDTSVYNHMNDIDYAIGAAGTFRLIDGNIAVFYRVHGAWSAEFAHVKPNNWLHVEYIMNHETGEVWMQVTDIPRDSVESFKYTITVPYTDGTTFGNTESDYPKDGTVLLDNVKLEYVRPTEDRVLVNQDFEDYWYRGTTTTKTINGVEENAQMLTSERLSIYLGEYTSGKFHIEYDNWVSKDNAGNNLVTDLYGAEGSLEVGNRVSHEMRHLAKELIDDVSTSRKEFIMSEDVGNSAYNHWIRLTADVDMDRQTLDFTAKSLEDEALTGVLSTDTLLVEPVGSYLSKMGYLRLNSWTVAGEIAVDDVIMTEIVRQPEVLDIKLNTIASGKVSIDDGEDVSEVDPSIDGIVIDFGVPVSYESIEGKVTLEAENGDAAALNDGIVIGSKYYAKIPQIATKTNYIVRVAPGVQGNSYESYKKMAGDAAYAFTTGDYKVSGEFSTLPTIASTDTGIKTVGIEVNNGSPEAIKYVIIAAYYNEHNKLIYADPYASTVEAGASVTESVEFTLPTLTNVTTVKYFLWDSINAMTAYCAAEDVPVTQ